MQNGVAVEPMFADPTVAAPMVVSGSFQSGTVGGGAPFAAVKGADLSRILPKRIVPSPPWVIPPSAVVPCSELTYVAHAALHPANLLIVVASILLVASHWGLGALAIALGIEAAYLIVFPTCGFFRRGVHAGLEQLDRQAKLRARDALVLQMGDRHRDELVKLEALLDGALAAGQRGRCAARLGAFDAAGMSRLTMSYIRLAVDHRTCAQALAMTDAAELHATIGSLEIASLTQPPHARPHLQRWLEIAKRRAERRREANATMESLSHQLATLAELTHLVHQDALSVSSSELSAEVDVLLEEFDSDERAASEVLEMGIVDAEG